MYRSEHQQSTAGPQQQSPRQRRTVPPAEKTTPSPSPNAHARERKILVRTKMNSRKRARSECMESMLARTTCRAPNPGKSVVFDRNEWCFADGTYTHVTRARGSWGPHAFLAHRMYVTPHNAQLMCTHHYMYMDGCIHVPVFFCSLVDRGQVVDDLGIMCRRQRNQNI